MSLNDSKGALTRAAKDLFARWNDVKMVWSDSQSAEFEKTWLDPLQQDLRSAMGALDQMHQTLMMIENDCG